MPRCRWDVGILIDEVDIEKGSRCSILTYKDKNAVKRQVANMERFMSMTITENMKPYINTMVDGENIEDKANIFRVIGMFVVKDDIVRESGGTNG